MVQLWVCAKPSDVQISQRSQETESVCRRSLDTQTKHFTSDLGIPSVKDKIRRLAAACRKYLLRHASDCVTWLMHESIDPRRPKRNDCVTTYPHMGTQNNKYWHRKCHRCTVSVSNVPGVSRLNVTRTALCKGQAACNSALMKTGANWLSAFACFTAYGRMFFLSYC